MNIRCLSAKVNPLNKKNLYMCVCANELPFYPAIGSGPAVPTQSPDAEFVDHSSCFCSGKWEVGDGAS